ncbi:Polyadenylate-binding protein-interacting protein 6 [Heracleum sosnowskyi]|uniref:Polyadenylate-binding protein-interacting protein 6 n=1 Tax=Heracleum sosnowskyi TaxID=360622 RepID=A0AAD8MEM6_9APIA|nr:Polyadenylate-binding protein-interacting protein 6 [Heracleum sosnowskyi]
MKAGTFSLNPYAASYIPISRRGLSDVNKGFELTEDASRSGDEAFGQGPQPVISTTNNQYQMARQSYTVQEKNKWDEQRDMDLTYLQMTFPGVSDDSLSVVYLANSGDLDATIEMLVQLELYTGDSSENLPDSLDIGDVAESGTSSHKLKNVTKSEVGGSSSV